ECGTIVVEMVSLHTGKQRATIPLIDYDTAFGVVEDFIMGKLCAVAAAPDVKTALIIGDDVMVELIVEIYGKIKANAFNKGRDALTSGGLVVGEGIKVSSEK